MSVILEVILKVSSRRHLLFYTILYMYNVNMNIAFSEGLYLNMISTLSSLRALDSKSPLLILILILMSLYPTQFCPPIRLHSKLLIHILT
jgi:hypothetical protein